MPPEPSSGAAGARDRRARRLAGIGMAVALAIGIALTLTMAAGTAAPLALDSALTDTTRGWADGPGWPVTASAVVGWLTAPMLSFVGVLALVLVLIRGRWSAAAAFLATSALLGVLLTEAAKSSIGRHRPPGAEAYQQDLTRSFPSGHASAGIYLYLATGVVLLHLGATSGRRWQVRTGRALVLLGPLIGVTRLVLGVHWPSDIVAGWAFGSAAALIGALALWDRLDHGWTPPRTPQPSPRTPTTPPPSTTQAPPSPTL